MKEQRIEIALIEDDDAYRRYVGMLLSDESEQSFSLAEYADLAGALKGLDEKSADIVLADITLPDSNGAATVEAISEKHPDIPIIVVTGHNDTPLAVSCLRAGAQDYLVKEDLSGKLLVRSIRYSIERFMMARQLRHLRSKTSEKPDMLSHLVRPLSVVTERMFGVKPLKASRPVDFNELLGSYQDILRKSLTEQMLKGEHSLAEPLKTLSERLGYLNAGPRDVIDLHMAAFKTVVSEMPEPKADVMTDESRLLVLEVMGYLVNYYRNYSIGFGDSPERRTS